MDVVREVLAIALFLYWLVLIGRLVFDFVQVFARTWQPRGPLLLVAETIYTLTDPPLRAIRRVIPPLRIGQVQPGPRLPHPPHRHQHPHLRRPALGARSNRKGPAMPLTAAEVATKFSTTRMRAGYDMDEVDAFLDIVEADVAQYADETCSARGTARPCCARSATKSFRSGSTSPSSGWPMSSRASPNLRVVRPQQPAVVVPVDVPVEAAPEIPPEVAEQIAADPEASSVLALAQRTADEILRYAETRAEGIRVSVRTMLTEQMALIDPSDV